jgi:hypothetical protein
MAVNYKRYDVSLSYKFIMVIACKYHVYRIILDFCLLLLLFVNLPICRQTMG